MSRPPSQKLRTPFRAPPSPAVLEANGMELMKTRRLQAGEDVLSAYRRALTMPWSKRIAETQPYTSGTWWIWLVTREAKEAA